MPIAVQCLGQSGCRFRFGRLEVLIDPYLSDRVADLYGEDLRRMVPPPVDPEEICDADWILVTHIHEDHCDPETLVPLLRASPGAKIVGPAEVCRYLSEDVGIAEDRIQRALEEWRPLGTDTAVRTVPAAHPEPARDAAGNLRCVGYLIRYRGQQIYHSGDTSPHPEVLAAATGEGAIKVAFLPVNERNYYRDRRDILGNMSIREAFQMAADLAVETLVPIHWDLFAPNSVFEEELRLLYDLMHPPFQLVLKPVEL